MRVSTHFSYLNSVVLTDEIYSTYIDIMDIKLNIYFFLDHNDWFAASVLARDGRVVTCAPRRMSRKMECDDTLSNIADEKKGQHCPECCTERHWTGYVNGYSNTGNDTYISKADYFEKCLTYYS